MSTGKSTPAQWILYTVIRLAIFVVVFLLLTATGLDIWLAGFATAAIGLCISYLFIPQPKLAPKAPKPDVDAEVEDALVDQVVDGSEGDGSRESKAE